MACWLYEGMLLFAVVFIADYLFSALSQTRHALENRLPQQIFLFLVLGIYFVWFWSRGQTLAMKTWHIRIVDRQGQALSQKRAFLRYTLSWLWFVPPWGLTWALGLDALYVLPLSLGWIVVWMVLARLHRDRQFVHDVIARTRLVSSPEAIKAAKVSKTKK
jgi:uncharacterized RDD family membrane protein YckC